MAISEKMPIFAEKIETRTKSKPSRSHRKEQASGWR